jgi:hypothetical protein
MEGLSLLCQKTVPTRHRGRRVVSMKLLSVGEALKHDKPSGIRRQRFLPPIDYTLDPPASRTVDLTWANEHMRHRSSTKVKHMIRA